VHGLKVVVLGLDLHAMLWCHGLGGDVELLDVESCLERVYDRGLVSKSRLQIIVRERGILFSLRNLAKDLGSRQLGSRFRYETAASLVIDKVLESFLDLLRDLRVLNLLVKLAKELCGTYGPKQYFSLLNLNLGPYYLQTWQRST